MFFCIFKFIRWKLFTYGCWHLSWEYLCTLKFSSHVSIQPVLPLCRKINEIFQNIFFTFPQPKIFTLTIIPIKKNPLKKSCGYFYNFYPRIFTFLYISLSKGPGIISWPSCLYIFPFQFNYPKKPAWDRFKEIIRNGIVTILIRLYLVFVFLLFRPR